MNKEVYNKIKNIIIKYSLVFFLLSAIYFLLILALYYINYNYLRTSIIKNSEENIIKKKISTNKKLFNDDDFLFLNNYNKYLEYSSISIKLLDILNIMLNDKNIYNLFKDIEKNNLDYFELNDKCKYYRYADLIIAEYSLRNQKICYSYLNFAINKVTNYFKEKPELLNSLEHTLSKEEEIFLKKKQLIFELEEKNEKIYIISFKEYLYNYNNKFIISKVLLSIFMSFISIYIFNTDNKKLKLF